MSGQDLWSTFPVERLGIPSIYMSDGPHGLRKVDPTVALGESVPATCFPTASAMASTWNADLIYKAGAAIGQECLRHDVQILLGPGINIKRSPLGGRNF
ncbi:MAG: glycoside hydrolase family 3 N-terminal domain-containing protein, partial [Bacteroidota bacterium]